MFRQFALIVFFGFYIFTAFAATPTDDLNKSLQSTIDHYLAKNAQSMHISAVQLSVLLPNESTPRDFITGTQYFGQLSQATTGMLTQWGSITKEYTNTLIFQLIQQGKFQETDTLGNLLPEYFSGNNSDAWPVAWQNVTLIQLMNMTSGITDYTSLSEFSPPSPTQEYTLADLANLAATYQNTQGCKANMGCFSPGATHFYSNTNYILLGMLIEKFSNTTYENALNALLQPFQQEGGAVGYYPSFYPADIFSKMIHGYFNYPDPHTWQDVTSWNMSWAASAGALAGNMHALSQITHALYSNQIIPIAELENHAVQANNGDLVTDPSTQCLFQPNQEYACYAMGLFLNYDPHLGEIWWYQGGTLGYATVYMWIPSENVVIAITQNSDAVSNELVLLILNKINPVIQHYLRLTV